ncbi:30S ribosomal protein S17 [Candidatus Falkowbacteria bacterium]|nr:30S ribosomal protein S17 [Candidatus Falkowbacteria bacterium]
MTKEVIKTENTAAAPIHRKFSGVVMSDKMDKTITVKVEQVKIHPKYKKRYTVSTKYKVHDEKNQYKVGDKVNFVECRPLSRDKRWRVVNA